MHRMALLESPSADEIVLYDFALPANGKSDNNMISVSADSLDMVHCMIQVRYVNMYNLAQVNIKYR
jgi:hypothetical protein